MNLPKTFLKAPSGRIREMPISHKDTMKFRIHICLRDTDVLGVTLAKILGRIVIEHIDETVLKPVLKTHPSSLQQIESQTRMKSIASKLGLLVGDIILFVNGVEIFKSSSGEQVAGIIRKCKPFIELVILRDVSQQSPRFVLEHPLACICAKKFRDIIPVGQTLFTLSQFLARCRLRAMQWPTGRSSLLAETHLYDLTILDLKSPLIGGERPSHLLSTAELKIIPPPCVTETTTDYSAVYGRGDIVINTRPIRYCLIVRVEPAFLPSKRGSSQRRFSSNFTTEESIFRISTSDVSDGARWEIDRSYVDFEKLRNALNALEPASRDIKFPYISKDQQGKADVDVQYKLRSLGLHRYIQRICGTFATMVIKDSMNRAFNLLHEFLDSPRAVITIPPPLRMAECYVYGALQIHVLDISINTFLELINENISSGMVDEIKTLKQYIKALIDLLIDNIGEDVRSILMRYRIQGGNLPADQSDNENFVEPDDYSMSQFLTSKRKQEILTAATEMDYLSDQIYKAVSRQVQARVIPTVMDGITITYEKEFSEQDSALCLKVQRLKEWKQSKYGIEVKNPLSFYLPDLSDEISWESAIMRLQWLSSLHCPWERAQAVVSVLDLIPLIYRNETEKAKRVRKQNNQDETLADNDVADKYFTFTADDILPIFIYIVVQASIPGLIRITHEMRITDHEGKADYALTTLAAAIDIIGTLEMI
jgi:hypothetical protein